MSGRPTHDLRCRWCAADEVDVILDLGDQPPADLFPLLTDTRAEASWPLRMALCRRCGLAQLLEDPGLREEPLGVEPAAMVVQAEQAVAALTAAGLVRAGARVIEFDSPHGGSWRTLLLAAGCEDHTASADLVVDVFGLMHEADQRALTERVDRLAPGGTLLLQFHSLASIVAQGQWNALRHGHMAYYSTRALVGMLAEAGLVAVGAWTFELYGGTVLLAARRDAQPIGDTPAATLTALLAADDARKLTRPDGLRSLAQSAADDADELVGWLTAHRDAGRRVVGYGAASRAVPLLVHAGIGPDLLPAVADGSPAKQGRCLPVGRVPIIAAHDLVERQDDVVLLFVPDLLDEVRAAYPQIEAHGSRWAVSEPRPHDVEPLSREVEPPVGR